MYPYPYPSYSAPHEPTDLDARRARRRLRQALRHQALWMLSGWVSGGGVGLAIATYRDHTSGQNGHGPAVVVGASFLMLLGICLWRWSVWAERYARARDDLLAMNKHVWVSAAARVAILGFFLTVTGTGVKYTFDHWEKVGPWLKVTVEHATHRNTH